MVCKSCGTEHGLEYALRDRGPEFHYKYQITATAIPESGRKPLALWLRRCRGISLSEALPLVRNPPIVITQSAEQHQVAAIRAEVELFGATLLIEVSEKYPNPVFGPLLQDRLHYSSGPRHTKSGIEMFVQPLSEDTNIDSIVCQHCGEKEVLTDEYPETEKCPACKRLGLIVEKEWIT